MSESSTGTASADLVVGADVVTMDAGRGGLRLDRALHEQADGDDDELAAVVTAIDCLTRGVTTVLEPGTVAHPLRAAKGLRDAGIRALVHSLPSSDRKDLP
jgi:hypothetical protein